MIKIVGARQHNLKNISLEIPSGAITVITGLSGSGKSSLAFDTLYAEGQRRYVESLSAYARQFLGQLQKPDVDYIEGLSPAIAIEQRRLSHNPRSIVATQTEVYDYFRLLFARLGEVRCYSCSRPLRVQSSQEIVDSILRKENIGLKAQILGPVIRGKKGQYKELLDDIRKQGFVRVRVDGKIYPLEEVPQLHRYKIHNIDVVVDRVIIDEKARSRITEAVELALKIGGGMAIVIFHSEKGEKEEIFSEHLSCPYCRISYPEIEPRLFSFNSPYGACPLCNGLGIKMEIDPEKVVPDPSLSLEEGALEPWRRGGRGYIMYYKSLLREFCYLRGIDMHTPFKQLLAWQKKELLYGSEVNVWGKPFEGLIPHLLRLFNETDSEELRTNISKYMSESPCPECKGARLRKESLSVLINGKNIWDLCCMDISSALRFLRSLSFSEDKQKISSLILREAIKKLEFCERTGVGYIQLNRLSSTLSGGESQRIRLATQIGSGLTGVLYVLDEPSIGLHPKDNQMLIDSLKSLRDAGNTLVVVEHDENTIRSADFVVDLGPGAGEHGGQVVFAGSVEDLVACPESLTAKYLRRELRVEVERKHRKIKGWITIKGAREHNLKNIDVRIPLGVFVCITGVSGSGKSTLVYEILYKALRRKIYGTGEKPGKHRSILGWDKIDKVIMVDQDPIGRTPRSNPATYTDVFTHIRRLFANLPSAKIRGFKPGRFSFNVKGGRCEACKGEGLIKIEMHFLPDVYVRCDVCKGRRYNEQTLQVKYKGYSIADVLDMSVEEARELFSSIPSIKRILDTLYDVGLGYIKLGQPATTLSGGEAQRVKLAAELSRRATGNTLYILDEPTTGLHFADEEKLLSVLHRLVDMGSTVVVIEHNLDVIKTADWIIDLGPEGGEEGGRVVFEGPIEEICKCETSYTGKYLKAYLERQDIID